MTNEEAIVFIKKHYCGDSDCELHDYGLEDDDGYYGSHEVCGNCEDGISIKALEKQIPIKPKINSKYENEVDWECLMCGLNVVEVEPYSNYCSCCGQKIDWSENEHNK